MSEMEPRQPTEGEVAPKRFPQEVVPVPIEDLRELLVEATRNTTLTTFFGQFYTGWMLLDMKLRVTPVDSGHTRIEVEVTGKNGMFDTLLFVQRRSAIDRFFVAIQDEVDRRARWRSDPHKPIEN
ncbi:MAG: hypothetical protein KF761_04180 [Salinibacterium sp.]|nr:hypothetical protein [Salinibacterium sp.]